MKDLSKYNEDCSKETKRPIYKKRYKKNGEEYLEKVDEIDIEEDLKEKKLEITRIKEIFNTQERLKAEELLDDLTNEEFLTNLKDLTKFSELDTSEFLNKTNELKEIYNKMPSEIRMKYNNLSKFGKEYLPKFISEKEEILKERKKAEETIKNKNVSHETNEEIQRQIEELQSKLNGGNENV